MIVLDTNVVSEMMRRRPAEPVADWLRTVQAPLLWTTIMTKAEILYGLAMLDPGNRRRDLEIGAMRMFETAFADRVLAFDDLAAQEFANIYARRRKAGRPIQAIDAQIAAIARANGMKLATRDVDDFVDCEIEIINPWTA